MEHKTIITLLIYTIIVAISTLFIFQKIKHSEKETTTKFIHTQIENLERLNEQQNQIIGKYRQNESKLKAEIVNQTFAFKEQLDAYEKTETQIKKLLAKKYQVDEVSEQLIDCDKLKSNINVLLIQSKQKDSLIIQTIHTSNILAMQQDSTINKLNANYHQLAELTELSIDTQKRLSIELDKTQKKLKRRTNANRILAGGLLILSGTITAFLVKQ